MKIILIGASGTIGTAVHELLKERHEVIAASKQGAYPVDFTDEKSLIALFEKVGPFDALICTAGRVHFAPLEEMTPALYQIGIQNKLMGQVNAVLIGRKYLRKGGSFTLTSGVLEEDPIRTGSSASMVNGAIKSFVKAAAIELSDMRINAVSPTIVNESLSEFGSFFRGFEPIPAARAALAYSKSVEGAQTGQVYHVT